MPLYPKRTNIEELMSHIFVGESYIYQNNVIYNIICPFPKVFIVMDFLNAH